MRMIVTVVLMALLAACGSQSGTGSGGEPASPTGTPTGGSSATGSVRLAVTGGFRGVNERYVVNADDPLAEEVLPLAASDAVTAYAGRHTSPGAADVFVYSLTIDVDGHTASIVYDDASNAPAAVKKLCALIRRPGAASPSATLR
jgi:hypothetical protein